MKRLIVAALLTLFAFPSLAASPLPVPPTTVCQTSAPLAVSAVSARVALPCNVAAFPTALIINDGLTEAFWASGSVTVVATTSSVPLAPGASIAVYLGASTNIAAITAAGTSTLRVVQANGSLAIDGNSVVTVGGTDDRLTVIPTVQNAAYASGNNIGGLVNFTLPRAASGILNAISLKFVGGATTAITAYCFDSNPSASTFTDKGTFTLALADLDKLIFIPQVMTPSIQGVGSAVTFQEVTSMARMFKSTTAIWCAYVAGGTFTPASAADMHVSVSYDLNLQ